MKSIYFRILTSTLLVFVFIGKAKTQDISDRAGSHKKLIALEAYYQKGSILPTNKFVRGRNREQQALKDAHAFSLRMSFQTSGSKPWQDIYNFPSWGFGFQAVDFNSPDEIGKPYTFYGFFSYPFKRWNWLAIRYDLEIGYSINWVPYSYERNPFNIAIGTKNNGYVGMGLNFEFRVSPYISLNYSALLTHYSNGAVKKPNLGINTLFNRLTARVNLYKDEMDYEKWPQKKFKNHYEWNISHFVGVKDVVEIIYEDSLTSYVKEGFKLTGISSSINKQLSAVSKVGLGITVGYDDANDGKRKDGYWIDDMELSIYPSYELVISRFSVILQPGFYLLRQNAFGKSPIFYQRIGFKYHFLNNVFAGINVRAFNFSVADYIEWYLGYRLDWN